MILRITILLFSLTALFVSASAAAPLKVSQATPAKGSETRQSAIAILSIIPAQGEPGRTVTLFGSGFSEDTSAFLGNTPISARVLSSKQLSFEIPRLEPGLYALYLQRKDGSTSKIYNFAILPQKPIVIDVEPDRINACDSPGQRSVRITGRNFLPMSKVMFDGAAIKSRYVSPEELWFTAPDVPAGLHQVQVENPENTFSTTIALFIDSKPEILGISQGGEYVNTYNLIIEGRNFHQNSTLIVDGKRLSTSGTYGTGMDRFTYVSCSQLIYERYPYDSSPKNIRIQVLNPNGDSSPVVQITAP
ncbi:MAG: hypothetical protein H6Q57_1337 [Geobacteraceae bacterium]|nr:hypothetical protein [Geobacteraceae bacterium]